MGCCNLYQKLSCSSSEITLLRTEFAEKHAGGHTVAGGTVWVSGEIPRLTDYENGILGGVRWRGDEAKVQGTWVAEEVGHLPE